MEQSAFIIIPRTSSRQQTRAKFQTFSPAERIITAVQNSVEQLTGVELVKKLRHFMEPAISLTLSQDPANYPYSEPEQTSPKLTPLLEYPF
jgi:hypothetical protein